MNEKVLNPGQILTGALFDEPMRVETVQSNGPSTWVLGLVGMQSEKFRKVTLTSRDLEGLKILESVPTYDGDGNLLRIGLQAYSLGIAYEFDPYFGLSISRVDPLPHQLEAVYDYLLKLARVRFLLADDAGAGKTIMAGLLIRELKLRGLAERILIVSPANLAFRDGNGRVCRLMLLLQCYHLDYEVGRYISVERLIEQNKERYYETLEQSSQGWHEGNHDPWPYINYLLFILKSAYREFEERVGQVKSPRGAKKGLVETAIEGFSGEFTLNDLEQACPGVSRDMVRRVLRDLQSARKVQCLGRGPGAHWRRRDITL
jgi:hypothetical protein